MGWRMVARAARVLLVLSTALAAQKERERKKKKTDKVDNPLCVSGKHGRPRSQKSLQARLSGVFGMIQ